MELLLGFPFLELLLDLLFTDSGSIKKKVRHFMFLPLASTMSVFNCGAVGVHAEKTFTSSRRVRRWTGGGSGGGSGGSLGKGQQRIELNSAVQQPRDPRRGFTNSLLCLFLHSEETGSD